jgi:diguanylate cyclase (GGDEF)-like protein
MSILIVDDAPINRLPLKAFLIKEGFNDILLAESAHEAFRHLGMEDPNCNHTSVDVILLDIMMPGIDGIGACRQIKAREWLRDIPIIMVTSLNEATDLEKAFQAGSMDYIVKPFNHIELRARLRSALALKHAMDCRKKREQELLAVTRQLEEANRKLQEQSALDGLTGIPNRSCFDKFIRRVFRFAARNAQPVSLILLDIDHFKIFNDTHGHQHGDDCLKQVAREISQGLRRPMDFVARYGGEEFVVVLADTDSAGALAVAEELRLRIESREIVHEFSPGRQHITISLGVATAFPKRHSSPHALIEAADLALYKAKRDGRNRSKVGEVRAEDSRIETDASETPLSVWSHLMEGVPKPNWVDL